MVGGDLTKADEWTVSLLTNKGVLAVDQQSAANHPAIATDKTVVWIAETPAHDAYNLAAFNRQESASDVDYSWKDLGLDGAEYSKRDLWEQRDLAPAKSFAVHLPAHGCVLYRLQAQGSTAKP